MVKGSFRLATKDFSLLGVHWMESHSAQRPVSHTTQGSALEWGRRHSPQILTRPHKFVTDLNIQRSVFNHLESRGNYSATSNNMQLVHWPLMGGLLHLVQRWGTGRGPSPLSPLFAVPNVTAHLSTASVPITVLLYNGPLLCGFNVTIKG